jgi:hypothetical protein
MKNSPLTTFLLAVLALSALLSVVFCSLYVSNTRQLRLLQGQMNIIKVRTEAITSLANETLEYSKRNPAIDPILESFNIKQSKTAPTAPNKPAAK